jgi:hypothetical protein
MPLDDEARVGDQMHLILHDIPEAIPFSLQPQVFIRHKLLSSFAFNHIQNFAMAGTFALMPSPRKFARNAGSLRQ